MIIMQDTGSSAFSTSYLIRQKLDVLPALGFLPYLQLTF